MRPIRTATAPPSTDALTATVDSTTSRNTPAMSSMTSTPNTSWAKALVRRPSSPNVFTMMLDDEMASMPPRNRLVDGDQPSSVPQANPAAIMSDISTTAVTSAGRPTVVSFTTLNCSPRPNMRKMTPICDQVDTLGRLHDVGDPADSGAHEESGHHVPQHERLFETPADDGGHRRHGEQQGEVVDELGYGLHRFLFAHCTVETSL